jgi:LysM repeat protein
MIKRLGKISILVCFALTLLIPFSQPAHAAGSTLEQQLAATGMKYLGSPYQWGASPHQTATFDCSSYTVRIFAESGITLPRTSAEQYQLGVKVPLQSAKTGDLVFFQDSQPGIPGHVGIYIGNMKMLSATVSKGTRVVDMSTDYWMARFIAVKRVLPQVHTVTDQDSLWKLSRSTGNSIQQLKAWNRLSTDMILTGSPLFISNPNLVQAATERSYHIVRPADSLWTISQQYGTTIEQLQRWNFINNIHMIYDGSRIYLEA